MRPFLIIVFILTTVSPCHAQDVGILASNDEVRIRNSVTYVRPEYLLKLGIQYLQEKVDNLASIDRAFDELAAMELPVDTAMEVSRAQGLWKIGRAHV